MTPRIGCVVLTQGARPAHLDRAVSSVMAQRDVDLDIVVVWNPAPATKSWPGVRNLELTAPVGIPGGRNAGAAAVTGDLVVFLDDDAALGSNRTLAEIRAAFDAAPTVGAMQPRVRDPEGWPPARRWVPRLIVGDPTRSSDVTAFWEGCIAIRSDVLRQVGAWPEGFWYMHEGIDLAWRIWDAGWRVRYNGSVTVFHQASRPARHAGGRWYDARNRAWLARRNLPIALGWIYIANWCAISVCRARTWADLTQLASGTAAGIRTSCGPRQAMRWRTVCRMMRAGRPPIV